MPGSQFRGFLADGVEEGGEVRKGMRTQRLSTPALPRTLGSGSTVALHYQPGPLEVSVAPRPLLPQNEWFSNTYPVGELAGKHGGSMVRSPRSENSGGWDGGDLKE